MGAWGHGPTQNDEAFDLLGELRDVLDTVAFEAFRTDELYDDDVEEADAAAEIIDALGKAGIDVKPRDAAKLALAWPDAMTERTRQVLSTACSSGRPGFAGERSVERWLREAGANYEVWMGAGVYGDDRAAAWRDTDSAETLLVMVRALGVADNVIARAHASCLIELLPTPPDESGQELQAILTDLARTGAAQPAQVDWLGAQAAAHQQAFAAAYRAARERGEPPPEDRDAQSLVLGATRALAKGGVSMAISLLHNLTSGVPDLAQRLRRHLEPLVSARLA